MTELSFLIDLLINPRDPEQLKKDLAMRIREVEFNMQPKSPTQLVNPVVLKTQQAPSTLALMAKHGDIPVMDMPTSPPPIPVEQIAQTPATAAAMVARQQSIDIALSGKVDKTTGRPRKW